MYSATLFRPPSFSKCDACEQRNAAWMFECPACGKQHCNNCVQTVSGSLHTIEHYNNLTVQCWCGAQVTIVDDSVPHGY